MVRSLLLKIYVLPLLTWSFFSFSALMVAELFPLNIVLIALFFNVMAVGYIFYFGIQHGFPSANTFGLSILAFHVLIGLFFYLYGQFVLLRESQNLLHRIVVYAISNAFVAPLAYLLFFRYVKIVSNKFK